MVILWNFLIFIFHELWYLEEIPIAKVYFKLRNFTIKWEKSDLRGKPQSHNFHDSLTFQLLSLPKKCLNKVKIGKIKSKLTPTMVEKIQKISSLMLLLIGLGILIISVSGGFF